MYPSYHPAIVIDCEFCEATFTITMPKDNTVLPTIEEIKEAFKNDWYPWMLDENNLADCGNHDEDE